MPKLNSFRDPDVLQRQLAGKSPGYVRIVGLDLGTNCGVAWTDIKPGTPADDAIYVGGQLMLDLGPYDTGPLRFIRLKQFLSVLQPDLGAYEEVRFTPDIKGFGGKKLGMIIARVANASELIGAMKVTLATWCEENDIPLQGYPIGAIKKHATQKGNANKEDMITAANAKFGVELPVEDYASVGADNIADALFIAHLAVHQYSRGLT